MTQIMCNHKNSFFIIIITIYTNLVYAKENTNSQKTCKEFQINEYHCPLGNTFAEGIKEGFVVNIQDNEIEIICSPNMMEFEFEMINSINLKNNIERVFTKLIMKRCPLPSMNFKNFFEIISSNDLIHLSFSNSNQSEISLKKKYFEGLTKLEYLNLDSNQFIRLEVDVFCNTPNLINLNLYDNFIEFDVDHFKNLKYLDELILAQNQLTDIPDSIFKELKTLNYLYLYNNSLQNLTSSSFSGLRDLKFLDLHDNNLSNIEEDTFKNLTNLEALDLTNNTLTSLPPNLLKYNKQLNTIIIRKNVNLRLPNYFLSNLTNLQTVDLRDSNLESISNDVFRGANNIEIIKLSGNGLKVLPDDLFEDLEKLKELHLNRNNLQTLVDPFKKLITLESLYLEDNFLKRIEENLFKDLQRLQILSLNRNNISHINSNAFVHNKNLKEIYAANNNISSNVGDSNPLFNFCSNLEIIDFSHNKITHLDPIVTINIKLHLKDLDFSYNHITSLGVAQMLSLNAATKINFEHNDIIEVNFENVELILTPNTNFSKTTILLSNNSIICDCLNYDLLRYFKRDFHEKVYDILEIKRENLTCSHPRRLRDVLFEKLEFIDITCPAKQMPLNLTCPTNCQCLVQPYGMLYIVNCSNRGLSRYPEIEFTSSSKLNQIELHLEFNNFTSGPSSVEIEKYYSSVTRLYLSNNYIKNITLMPAKLQLLQLNNNSLERLDDEFLKYLNTSSISNLTLYGNPWICECNKIENFAQYLRNHPKQVVAASSIFCANTEIAIIDLNKNSLCKEWQLIALIFVIMSVLMLCALTIAAYYRYQREIKVWLYSKQLCLWWVTEEEVDKEKIYDAFLSYSHKDENFVIQNLLPVLESGTVHYKICLHTRDWIPGEFITAQVAQSVHDSRRTIIILSSNFVESVWGKLEFRTAHTQAMMEGRARVIVILHGDVDIESLDEELKAYLRTNTYVKWGDPYFWDKLKYALPHLKNTRHKNSFRKYEENTINAIKTKESLNSSTLLLSSTTMEKPYNDFIFNST